ncbi:superoxide dismutase [Salmonella enterica subsp. enterica]|uniref:superoxide dismutase n=1 Tax=Salmonella enterica I TaxID=59201 RepID=A0A379X396_SALET|nr:superoxide dismutase [Salmonella enterica subsp. enterica]
MSYTLPSLPYAYDALEPHFDKQTMEDSPHQNTIKPMSTTLTRRWKNLPEVC